MICVAKNAARYGKCVALRILNAKLTKNAEISSHDGEKVGKVGVV